MAALVVPNLKLYGESVLQEIEEGEQREDAEMAALAVLKALETLVLGSAARDRGEISEDEKNTLVEKIGPFFASRLVLLGKKGVINAVLNSKG